MERSFVEPRQSTPHDLGLLYERVARGELLSATSREYLFSLLREPSRGDDERIGASLPECGREWVAHKPGTTFESGLDVVADAGYVRVGTLEYVIVVLGNAVAWVDYEEGMRVIADISSVTLSDFYREHLAAP